MYIDYRTIHWNCFQISEVACEDGRGTIRIAFALIISFYLAFAMLPCVPRTLEEIIRSFDATGKHR